MGPVETAEIHRDGFTHEEGCEGGVGVGGGEGGKEGEDFGVFLGDGGRRFFLFF